MKQKHSQNMYHANVNINLMVENLTQIKSGITINAEVSTKIKRTFVKKCLYLES